MPNSGTENLDRLTLERDLCFLEIIEGETDNLERQVCESKLLAMVKRSGISIHSIEICAAGCFVIIHSRDVAALKTAARSFNVAVRVVEQCGRIAVRREAGGSSIPSLADVISAFHDECLPIVHVSANDTEMFVLVHGAELHSATAIMKLLCASAPAPAQVAA